MADSTLENIVDDVGDVAGVASKIIGIFGGALPGSGWIVTALNVLAAMPAAYTDVKDAAPIATKIINAGLSLWSAAASKTPVDPERLKAQQAYINDMQSAVAAGLPHDVAIRMYPNLAQHETLFG